MRESCSRIASYRSLWPPVAHAPTANAAAVHRAAALLFIAISSLDARCRLDAEA
jgi:hypothetical protein